MNVRTVDASHGWRWIAHGFAIFRKSPALWVLLLAVLFVGSRLLFALPLVGVIVVLVAPNFLAGLVHGAQALEHGKPLRFGYLASGFLKNAPQLITIGGVSLIGQFLTLMAMVVVGGDAIGDISRSLSVGPTSPEAIEAVRAAAPRMMMAMLVGLGLSLPLMMAVWFAPLLVFFDDVSPWAAIVLSLWACLKNVLPMLVYSTAVLVPTLALTPVSIALRQPDLGLWLLAPALVPSIYASYRDLFVREGPAA